MSQFEILNMLFELHLGFFYVEKTYQNNMYIQIFLKKITTHDRMRIK
jgi:hypothetical protein